MKCLIAALMMLTALGTVGVGMAQAAPEPVADPVVVLETIRLWPGAAPQSGSAAADETPTLTVFTPRPGTENGTAVIVAPGGGYLALAIVHEGRQVADWFTSRGVTAFLLNYRVGAKSRPPVPFLDGQRAVRMVRSNAAKYKINPDRIGMIGFSAGGHLTATTAGNVPSGDAKSRDPVERASSNLNFVVLAYPWLEGLAVGPDGKSQYCTFLGSNCDPLSYGPFRPIRSVTPKFPPTFLFHTTTDPLVRPDGVVAFYQALVANNVPTEIHIFANGPHGVGLGGSDPALGRWPELLELWLRGQGLLSH